MNLKKLKYLLFLLMATFVLSSCSETDTDEAKTEYAQWQERNDKAFADTLAYARQQVANQSKEWKVILNWSLQGQTPNKDADGNDVPLKYKDTDYIVVHVLHEGAGAATPLYTDSVQLSYRGRLLPTASYASGYVFDQTFEGAFSPSTAKAIKTTVDYGYIDGFTTALLSMRPGDHWQVFIPNALGYGTSDQSSIPGYSMLRFEMALHGCKGTKGGWISE